MKCVHDLPYGLMTIGATIMRSIHRLALALTLCGLAAGLTWREDMQEAHEQRLPVWPYRDAVARPEPFIDVLIEIQDPISEGWYVDLGFWNGAAWVLTGAPEVEVEPRRWAPVPKPEPRP